MWDRISIALTIAVLSAACGPGKPPRPPAPDRTLSYRDDVNLMEAHNGMRILIMPDPTTNLVDVHLRFRVGSMDDPPGKAGLAHLVEHLTFELDLPAAGTETIEAALARTTLASNAHTTWDSTHYQSQALRDAFPEVLAVEMGRLGADCATLPQEVFEREREVVRNEIRQRGGAGARLVQYLLEAGYPEGHPYRRPIGGDDLQVAALTRDDVCGFMDAHYAPSNATLIVAGATSAEEVKAILNRHLGGLPPRPAAPRPQVAAGPLLVRTIERSLDVEEATAVAIYAMPPATGLADYAASYAQAELADKLSDEADGEDWITATGVFRLGGTRAPLLVAGVSVSDPAKLRKAVAFIDEQVRGLKIEATDFQLAMVRESAQTGLLRQAERLSSRAQLFGDYLQFDSGLAFLVGDLERLGRLTIADVQRVARKMFARRAVVLIRPNPKAGHRERRAALTFTPGTHGDADRGQAVDPAEAERPLVLPGGRAARSQLRRITLDNGMDVLLLPAATMPLIDVRLILGAGSAQDPVGKAGVAELAARLMVPSLDEFERIRELLVFYRMGGSFDPVVSEDFTVFRVRGANVFLDGLVHGLAALMRHGRYDGDLVAEVRKRVATALDKPDAVRAQRLQSVVGRALYGEGHPYARAAAQTGAAMRAIGDGDLQQFRERYYVPRNATLVVAGRFDVELMEQHVRHAFAGWSSDQPRFPGVDAPARARATTVGWDDDDEVLLGVQIAYPTGAGLDEQHAARLVLEEMLDTRMRVVRERLAASYGVHASHIVRRGPGVLEVNGAIDAARGGEGLAAIRAGIDGLRRQDEQFVRDFVLARRAVARRLIADATDSGSLAGELSLIAQHGKGPRYFGQLVDEVARLRPADVAALAARELAADRETLVVAADRPVIEAAFKTAGLPPPRFVR